MVIPAIYLTLLVASFVQRTLKSEPPLALLPNQSAVMVPEIRDGLATGREIRIAYLDYSAGRESGAVRGTDKTFPIVLVHGSPGSGDDLRKLAATLKGKRRLLARKRMYR